jgi:hypothetical protein
MPQEEVIASVSNSSYTDGDTFDQQPADLNKL